MLKTPAAERHGGYNCLVRLGTRVRAQIGLVWAGAVIPAVSLLAAIAVLAASTGCQDVHVIAIRVMAASPDATIDAPTDHPVPDGAMNDALIGETGGGDGSVPVVCSASGPVGFANWMGTTTGGGTGAVVNVSTVDQLKMAAAMPVPLVIQIDTMMSITGQVAVLSDKTIVGIAPGAGLTGGGLLLTDAHNIIVQNLIISNATATDAIGVQRAQHIWIDHCDLSANRTDPIGTYDGLVDITHASDFVTVSWTHFHDFFDNSLVGHSYAPASVIEDPGHLTVTYHHNWFQNIDNHSPRVRFGSVHVFNNLYQDIRSTAVISQMNAVVLVEGNVFWHVGTPIETVYMDPIEGTVNGNALTNNVFAMMSGLSTITMTNTWVPPYVGTYRLDSTDNVPLLVQTCAGPRP